MRKSIELWFWLHHPITMNNRKKMKMLKESLNIMNEEMKRLEQERTDLKIKIAHLEEQVGYLQEIASNVTRIMSDNGAYQFDTPEEIIAYYERQFDDES